MTYHGRETLKVSTWSEGLTEIVNDKARFSGRIGPYGPAAEFQYSGGAEAFQRVLEKFARLKGQAPRLYLHPGTGTPEARQQTAERHDFAMSIAVTGEGSLHVFIGRIPLESIKIPENVIVAEAWKIGPQSGPGGEDDGVDARHIAAFLKKREASRKPAK